MRRPLNYFWTCPNVFSIFVKEVSWLFIVESLLLPLKQSSARQLFCQALSITAPGRTTFGKGYLPFGISPVPC